jgi:heme a synthase
VTPSSSAAFSRASWALLAFTLVVVGWGGLVRASRSGDGCGSHWPTCNGEVFPSHPVLKTRIEFTHRVLSGASLAFTVAWAAWAFRRFDKGSWARRGAAAALLLLLVEALIGAAIVLLRLVGADASSSRVVGMGLHSVSTFFLLAALLLTALWTSGTAGPRLTGQRPLSPLLGASLGLVLLLGVTGALAALGDTLFPVKTLAEGFAQDASANAPVLVRLRILHPVVAGFGATVLLATAAAASVLRTSASVRRAALALGLAVLAQLVVGLVNLALLAPLGLQLLHLALADLVWLCTVALSAKALAADAVGLPLAAQASVP